MKIIKAPEPSDILWENCEKPNKIRTTLVIWIIMLCLCGLFFGFLFLLAEIQKSRSNLGWLLIVNIVLIHVFYQLISIVIVAAVKKEQNYTQSTETISIMNKQYFFFLATSIGFPLIYRDHLDSPNGLMGFIHDYQLILCLLMVFFSLINIPYRIV